eukprot:m.1014457 g.1014457  ORF g.1014457 m.1014457 type:complete len:862 (+) comp24072_c0_seq8:282-2867(+)
MLKYLLFFTCTSSWSITECDAAGIGSQSGPKYAPIDPDKVKVVHLIQSNHLDLGFSDYTSNVINRYFTGEWGTAAPPAPRNKTIYYDSFFLNAANTSRILRQKFEGKPGAPGYVYLVHPWLVKLFFECNIVDLFPHVNRSDALRCPTLAQTRTFKEALNRGDAVMHAFSHSSQPEVMDAVTFFAALDTVGETAAYLGVAPPRVLSQRDVPGLARSTIPLLAKHNVLGISVGANDGSPPPVVPSTVDCFSGHRQIRTPFVWEDRSSASSVIVDIHPGGYGGVIPLLDPKADNRSASIYSRDGLLCDCVGVPGLDDIMCYAFRGDNYGPASVRETEDNFVVFGAAFPNATIHASTLDKFFSLLNEPTVRDALPRVTAEIGDTWIFGVSSDPLKTATMRAMMRQRTRHVNTSNASSTEEPGMDSFTHMLLKTSEHTWGGSYAGHMQVFPPSNWSNTYFNKARENASDPFYAVAEESWDEQREFLASALHALDEPFAPAAATVDGRAGQSPLAAAIREEVAAITAPAPDPRAHGYNKVDASLWTDAFQLGASATVAVDPATGGVVAFQTEGGMSWASPSHPLLRFMYRTHSYAEKCRYAKTYQYSHGGIHPYSPGAYTPPSPGLNASASLEARQLHAPVAEMWALPPHDTDWHQGSNHTQVATYQSVVLRLNGVFPQSATSDVPYSTFGAVWVNLTAASGEAGTAVTAEIVWEAKTPTRLPESTWVEFRPRLPPPPTATPDSNGTQATTAASWRLTVDKLGAATDTADVVGNGGAAVHGMAPDGAVTWQAPHAQMAVYSLDAAIVAPGWNVNIWDWDAYAKTPVDPHDGAAVCLHNNLYTTNYILWYPWHQEDSLSRFRFRMEMK